MNYNDKLDKAYDEIEDIGATDVRFDLPEPDSSFDGSYTTYRNFKKSAERLNRDKEELLTFFQESLATSGSLNDQTAKFKGQFSDTDLKQHLDEYYELYVKCRQCGSPDTQYEEQSGVEVIRCTACGATEPKP